MSAHRANVSLATVPAGVRAPDLSLWQAAELRRQLLRRMAQALYAHGLELIAVKGIHLAFVFASEPWYRPMDDADAYVPGGAYRRAASVLAADGRFVVEISPGSSSVASPGRPMVHVDLNRWLLPPFFGSIPERQLIARAWRKTALGDELLVPDPVDAAVLVLGHFAKDGIPLERVERVRLDLGLLSEKADVTPETLAARLVEWRLRRRGLLALSALAMSDDWFMPWKQALIGSQFERALAEQVASRVTRFALRAPGAAGCLAAAFGDSPTNSVSAFGFTSVRAVRSWWLKRRARGSGT